MQITPNPRAASALGIYQNQRARGSTVVTLDWDHITGKPEIGTDIQGQLIYASKAEAEASTPPSGTNIIYIRTYDASGQAGDLLAYRPFGSTPGTPKRHHLETADGTWWYYAPAGVLDSAAWGLTPGSSADQSAALAEFVLAGHDYYNANFTVGTTRYVPYPSKLRPGSYLTSAAIPLTTAHDLDLTGAVIRPHGSYVGDLFTSSTLGKPLIFRCRGGVIDGFASVYNLNNLNAGLAIFHVSRQKIINCSDTPIKLQLETADILFDEQCQITGPTKVALFTNTSTAGAISNIVFRDCTLGVTGFTASGQSAVELVGYNSGGSDHGGDKAVFENIKWAGAAHGGAYTNLAWIYANECQGVIVRNNRSDSDSGVPGGACLVRAACGWRSSSSSQKTFIVVEDCEAFDRSSGGDAANCVRLDKVPNVLIVNNNNTQASTRMVGFASGASVSTLLGAATAKDIVVRIDANDAPHYSGDADEVPDALIAPFTKPIAGTAAEITVTYDGNRKATLSLPAAMTFTGKTVTGGTFASLTSLSIGGALHTNSIFTVAGASPISVFKDTGAGTDEKAHGIVPSGTGLFFTFINDAGNSSVTWLQVTRSGITPQLVTLPRTPLRLGTAGTIGGQLDLAGSSSGVGSLVPPAAASSYVWTLPAITGTLALTGNKLSVFAATTSAELAGVISDETGSGALVFANTPTLVTPVLGAATATSINGVTLDNNAWTSYTPTVTASSGTFTSVNATGFYKVIGKTVFYRFRVNIVTVGSAAGRMIVTLPTGTVISASAGMGTGLNSTTLKPAFSFAGVDSSSSTSVVYADGTFPGTSGDSVYQCGIYEQA